MANATPANYVFLPWVRQGAAAGIQTLDMSAAQAGVVAVTAALSINNTDTIARQIRLIGPGDITGIDAQQVVRTEPRPLATDFEPNYFPAIEFDRPDFPWLFTPARANDAGKLRPWLCLVVVRKQEGVSLQADRNRPLPVLEIKAPAQPARELPDLAESWAWAHAQVIGSPLDAPSLRKSLAGNPALTVSRLLCPRRLDPLTDYLACVVPAFELGCKAGLGALITPEDEKALKPAWDLSQPAAEQVTLPVYFHWEFHTGAEGDFEELVRLLEARKLPQEVGKRLLDISQPGFKLTPALPPDTTLELEGALRLPLSAAGAETPPVDWSHETQAQFQSALKLILDAPSLAMNTGIEPLLAPPIYGSWQAARPTVNLPPIAPQSWLDQLNLDPRHRAVAALGTQVVQTQQEPLMAAAWEQLGEIQRVNQIRRQAQLARSVNGVYHAKHFSRFSAETLLKVVASAQARIVVEAINPQTHIKTRELLSQRIAQSAMPDRAVSGPLRRLTSQRGVISRRFLAIGAPPIALVARLNATTAIALQRQAAGLVTLNQPAAEIPTLAQIVRSENVANALDNAPRLFNFNIVAEASLPQRSLLDFQPGPSDSPTAQAFRKAAKVLDDYLEQEAFITFITAPTPPMQLADTKAALLQSVHPAKTINARVEAALRMASGAQPPRDPIEPILDAPDFPQPMYEALRDLSQDFLFPGLEHVPPNTITLLKTNPKFVESFLVGLNTEMSHELLWRNYPTDQRGTYFSHFWDTSISAGPPDIQPIHTWGKESKLGDNTQTGENLVLLLRGELLRRYPNSVIYAVKAVLKAGQLALSADPAEESHPLFRGTLKPDITFLGFELTRDQALLDPGWFFVIQEQPSEPRFGLDVAEFNKALPELATWNNLNWRHVANSEEALHALSHASIKTVLPVIDKVEWGKNAAHQAYSTLQRPVRIAIHARDMIPK